MIYLDHNASTPVLPPVREALLLALDEGFGNPGAGHFFGRRASAFVETAREQVAALLGASPDEIVFTSGATESNNLALRGTALLAGAPWLRLLTSSFEHPATTEPAKVLQRQGATWIKLPVEPNGRLEIEAARAAIESLEGPAIVSLILAQNETGVIQPLAELAHAARARGAIVHIDAAQAVGKIPVSVEELGADLLSVAGHKLYAPKGVGALYVRRGTRIAPLLVGAPHEAGLRPGTANVSGIAGLGAACALAASDLVEEAERQRALRDRLEALLVEAGFIVHGAAAERLPNTSNGRFPGLRGSTLLAAVPGIAASQGSACHSGSELPSQTLLAMGVDAGDALGAIRLSLGRGTTAAIVDEAARLLREAAAGLS